MNYRKLGKTNFNISEIALGTWQVGGKWGSPLKEVVLLVLGYRAILDFFLIRPFCTYWMPVLTGNYFMGILLGKITANPTFYALAILNHELLKKKQ